MNYREILEQARSQIRDYAGEDPDKWWYANRFVFARLQLDERKTKVKIKEEFFNEDRPCYRCKKPFEKRTGVHLHRIDTERGYSRENCALMHPECHRALHSESVERSPEIESDGDPTIAVAGAILRKKSKKYDDGSFVYWWDFTPGTPDKLRRYDSVEFIKKDSGESCSVSPDELQKVLTPERRTSRGTGNWGIKVLRDFPDEIAIEPGQGGGEWVRLPVIWMEREEEEKE